MTDQTATTDTKFASTWLNATMLGLEEVRLQLSNTEIADLLQQRITTLREEPNTLLIMETLQAAEYAKQGDDDKARALLQS